MNPEKSIQIAVSRKAFGFTPDQQAFKTLGEFNKAHGVSLGIEHNPHRLVSLEGLTQYENNFGVTVVGIHGPLQPSASTYYKEIFRNITKTPRDYIEARLQMIWLLGFGPLHEPAWLKRYGSHMELAQTLNAYVVMHEEPLRAMGDALVKEWSKKVRIVRENGWGSKDNRKEPLSWNWTLISEYCQQHEIGSCLDTATAARTSVDNGNKSIIDAWKILRPNVIHFSDRLLPEIGENEVENLIPGEGSHGDELAELLQRINKSPNPFYPDKPVTLVLEVDSKPNPYIALERSLNFVSKHLTIS